MTSNPVRLQAITSVEAFVPPPVTFDPLGVAEDVLHLVAEIAPWNYQGGLQVNTVGVSPCPRNLLHN